MNNSKLENLVNVPCPLIDAYRQLVPESIWETHKIQRRRINDTKFMFKSFITGDGCVYNFENGQAVLYLTNAALNPVLKQNNIADALSQIKEQWNCHVRSEDFSMIQKEALRKNGGAKRYLLSDLGLTEHNNEISFFEIDTKKHLKLNTAQRILAEQVHGKGKRFEQTMELLREIGISKTRIYVLSFEYVQNAVSYSPVARVGGLGSFNSNSNFIASGRDLNANVTPCVVGARRESIV